MLVDGKKIAEDIRRSVRTALSDSGRKLSLSVISVGGDAVTQQFVGIKKKIAEDVGIILTYTVFPHETTTEELCDAIAVAVISSNGIIVQLPLPAHIDRVKVFETIPASHDVDCLGNEARGEFEKGTSPLLPPVVSAIQEIVERHSIAVVGKKVVVVGRGMLVGAPVATWFTNSGAHVVSVDKHDDIASYTKDADIIVLGAGHPYLLKPDMIQSGVVVFDAGTSEDGGKIVGDADPTCAQKTALLTPVPGGIGPIAVAKIFENLLICTSIAV